MAREYPVRDNWAYAVSSDPAPLLGVETVDWMHLHSETWPTTQSIDVLAGLACNQRHVGLANRPWLANAHEVRSSCTLRM